MHPLDSPLVLIVEEEPRAAEALATALRVEGLQVIACRHAVDGVNAVSFHRPSIVVVDVATDDGRGWDVLTAARDRGRIPAIVVDREGDASVRRAAYVAGADDVIGAPVDPAEVAARVQALIRRGRPETRGDPVLRHADLLMDVAAHEVRVGGLPVTLTAQQFAILRVLLEAHGATLEREQLIARTESLGVEPPSDRAIDLHVTRLRRRLGDDARKPRYIESVYGVGYRLAPSETVHATGLGVDPASLLDALPDAVLVVDGSLEIRFANDAAARLLAVPRTAFAGQQCGALLQCQSCAGASLSGPRCFGHIVLGGHGQLRDAPAFLRGPDGPLPVTLSYGELEAKGGALLTITIRPREDAAI
jgi:two-component system, OmpR family, alkaline phosphatase synthesis response regulator PhoP